MRATGAETASILVAMVSTNSQMTNYVCGTVARSASPEQQDLAVEDASEITANVHFDRPMEDVSNGAALSPAKEPA